MKDRQAYQHELQEIEKISLIIEEEAHLARHEEFAAEKADNERDDFVITVVDRPDDKNETHDEGDEKDPLFSRSEPGKDEGDEIVEMHG